MTTRNNRCLNSDWLNSCPTIARLCLCQVIDCFQFKERLRCVQLSHYLHCHVTRLADDRRAKWQVTQKGRSLSSRIRYNEKILFCAKADREWTSCAHQSELERTNDDTQTFWMSFFTETARRFGMFLSSDWPRSTSNRFRDSEKVGVELRFESSVSNTVALSEQTFYFSTVGSSSRFGQNEETTSDRKQFEISFHLSDCLSSGTIAHSSRKSSFSLSTSHSRRQSFHFTSFYVSIRRSPFFISFDKWVWRHRTATQRTNVQPRWSFGETFPSTTFSEPIQRIVWYQRTFVSSFFIKHREASLCLLSVTSWIWSPMEFVFLSVRVEHLFVCKLMKTSFYDVNVNFRGSGRLETSTVIKSLQCYTFIVEEKHSLIVMCRSAEANYSHRLQSFDQHCLWSRRTLIPHSHVDNVGHWNDENDAEQDLGKRKVFEAFLIHTRANWLWSQTNPPRNKERDLPFRFSSHLPVDDADREKDIKANQFFP